MKLVEYDPWLAPFSAQLEKRHNMYKLKLDKIRHSWGSLAEFASSNQFFGLHKTSKGWVFREWAPNATELYIVGEFSEWKPQHQFLLEKQSDNVWSIDLPEDTLKHGDYYKLWMVWDGGAAMRIPTHVTRAVQNPDTLLFSAQVWHPKPFKWSDTDYKGPEQPSLIYEAHIGMALEEERVGTYLEFTEKILPRIKKAGYNMVQLMAIQEHPYYGSFGYHVSNFFAVSSRFGTPEDLKHLINEAHKMGIAVIMDIVHSHSVKNEEEGISRFDGSYTQFFHAGDRGNHPAWDSRCFDYSKEEVLRFLLSNCRYWIEEFHFDGYRFDGVTSMLYLHHGLGLDFTSYHNYFDGQQDEDAILYLMLANQLIHDIQPKAVTIAEEMSGFPGIGAKPKDDGLGFDYRLSMGVPDFWIKLIKEISDENWQVGYIFNELIQHRPEEKIIAYAESHDQALVGDKTIIFRLADKEMYHFMGKDQPSLIIDRAIALHKMIRLITMSTAHGGYLNFMGNEFGHPEWIDFPREGNNWSYKYARRQWSLMDNDHLKFSWLAQFDKNMIELARKFELLRNEYIHVNLINNEDQVLAFERGSLLFVFNFSPTRSYTDYGIPVNAGKFKIVLNSDATDVGGFNRIDEHISYYSTPIPLQRSIHQVKLYIPSRTVVVYKRLEVKSVYDV